MRENCHGPQDPPASTDVEQAGGEGPAGSVESVDGDASAIETDVEGIDDHGRAGGMIGQGDPGV
jgi:hypothetical protein